MQFFWAHFSLISRLKSTFFAWWKKKTEKWNFPRGILTIVSIGHWAKLYVTIHSCWHESQFSYCGRTNYRRLYCCKQSHVLFIHIHDVLCLFLYSTQLYKMKSICSTIERNHNIRWKNAHTSHTDTNTYIRLQVVSYNCRANVPNQENVHVSCINRNVE